MADNLSSNRLVRNEQILRDKNATMTLTKHRYPSSVNVQS
jgi:hypothetical protein